MQRVWIAGETLRSRNAQFQLARNLLLAVPLWVDQAKRPACRPEAPRWPECPAIACRTISFVRQLHISVVGVWFRGWICLIGIALAEVRRADAPDLKRGCLLILSNHSFHRLKTRPVKVSAEREV